MIFCSILPLWVNWYGGCFMAVRRWRSGRSRRRRRSCTCSRCLSCICYPDSRTRLTSPARWGGNRSHVVYLHPLLKFTFRSCFCFMDWLCVPPESCIPNLWLVLMTIAVFGMQLGTFTSAFGSAFWQQIFFLLYAASLFFLFQVFSLGFFDEYSFFIRRKRKWNATRCFNNAVVQIMFKANDLGNVN